MQLFAIIPQPLGILNDPAFAGLTITGNSVFGLNSSVFQPTSDSTTFFQVLDADGGTSILNVDTTNERVGIGIDTPLYRLHTVGTGIISQNTGSAATLRVDRVDGVIGTLIAGGDTVGFYFDETGSFGIHPTTRATIEGTVFPTATTFIIKGSDGFVGIGIPNANPLYQLQVFGTGILSQNTGGAATLRVDKTDGVIGTLLAGGDTVGFYFDETGVFGIQSTTRATIQGTSFPASTMFVINGSTGFIGVGEVAPETLTEWTSTVPYLTLHNSTHEDSDGGRESQLNFKGEQTGGEETTLARIEISHDGAADDEKGKVVISTNDGSDTNTPTDHVKIDAAGNTYIGDGGTTNFTKIEPDGTVEFNGAATVFKDINLGSALLTKPAASAPDTDEFKDEGGNDTGIETYAFAPGEKVSGNFELQHDYKEGSDITFHVHFQGIAAPTGTDKVKWQLIYTVSKSDATLDATTTIVKEIDFDTQYEFLRADFVAITGTNFLIEDQFLFQLSRVTASADEYGGDALIATVGIHYEIDTVGSRAINTK